MKTVSIRELHHSTGKIVRSVETESAIVTDRGRPVAILVAATAERLPGKPLSPNHWDAKRRPVVDADSTEAVSEGRNR